MRAADAKQTSTWGEARAESTGVRAKDPAVAIDLGLAMDPDLVETGESRPPDSIFGDRYAVHGMLGVGGMGAVLAATDVRTGREVALKVLSSALSRDDRARCLRHEMTMTSLAASEHVARVEELHADAPEPFLVTERLSGETLRERISREGTLSLADAVEVVDQLLEALEAVHGAGIVHRDIKPANVFLTDRDAVKLIDFGIAAFSDATIIGADANVTAGDADSDLSCAYGSFDYMPPERLLGHPEINPRADIWAVGITLYIALTGEHPFQRERSRQMETTLLDDPTPVTSLRDDIPRVIDDIIARALAKDPEWRFPSAPAFRTALRNASYLMGPLA